MPQSIAFSRANMMSAEMRKIFQQYPEVKGVISQNGRPNDGTDPTGFFNVEFFVDLFPKSEWTRGVPKEEIIKDMQGKLFNKFPGVVFGFSQPISDNVQEAVSGVKGEMAIKIFGDGNQRRSFCYVDDLIQGIMLYAEQDLSIPLNQQAYLRFAQMLKTDS